MGAGGVFAHTMESDGINVWYFPRNAIPADIQAEKPDPSSWGTPQATLSNSKCDIASNFVDHTLVLDTTLCGDWAAAVWTASGVPGQDQSALVERILEMVVQRIDTRPSSGQNRVGNMTNESLSRLPPYPEDV